MTKHPKKKLRYLSNKLNKEIQWMLDRLKYIEGPMGWDGKGQLGQIPYVPLASVKRQRLLMRDINRVTKEIRKK